MEQAPVLPSFRHVLPVVGASAPSELRDAQRLTLDSISRAREFSAAHVAVEVVGARFPDEGLPGIPWLVDAPVLHSSSVDVGTFKVPRRLPLLREVLSAYGDVDGLDALVLTNTDIGIQPAFYEIVRDILGSGYDAFTINRRSIPPVFAGGRPALSQAAVGRSHPGTDCFVFAPGLLAQIDVGRVLMGTKYVARTLLDELVHRADRFREFAELHATFHVGDDRIWKRPELADYEAFNRSEFGARRAGRAAEDGSDGVREARPGSRAGTVNSPAREETGRHRMIFCTAPARSGTMFLAELLAAASGVDAGHERAPTMSGPWLRDVSERGLRATYAHRMAKVDAVRIELERLPRGATYADTSHLFLTMFHDVILDSFDHRRLSLVALRRDPVDIARSMFELGWFTRANRRWEDWFLDPAGAGSPVEVMADELKDPLETITLHLARVLHERERLRGATPTVQWVDVDLPTLRSRGGRRTLYSALGLRSSGRGSLRWPRPVNARVEIKRAVGTTITRGEVRDRIEDVLSRFENRAGFRALREELQRW